MNSLRYLDFGQSRHLLLLIGRIALVVLFIILRW